jgi:hypothetical protein
MCREKWVVRACTVTVTHVERCIELRYITFCKYFTCVNSYCDKEKSLFSRWNSTWSRWPLQLKYLEGIHVSWNFINLRSVLLTQIWTAETWHICVKASLNNISIWMSSFPTFVCVHVGGGGGVCVQSRKSIFELVNLLKFDIFIMSLFCTGWCQAPKNI